MKPEKNNLTNDYKSWKNQKNGVWHGLSWFIISGIIRAKFDSPFSGVLYLSGAIKYFRI